jgi:F0F1-type ATP synthase assembly protein I
VSGSGSEPGMPGKQTQRGDTARAYGIGFQLVCAVAGFVLVGVWIDRHYNSGPWGTLICLVLGLIGGFYNLFRESSRLFAGGGAVAARPAAGPAGGPESHPGGRPDEQRSGIAGKAEGPRPGAGGGDRRDGPR